MLLEASGDLKYQRLIGAISVDGDEPLRGGLQSGRRRLGTVAGVGEDFCWLPDSRTGIDASAGSNSCVTFQHWLTCCPMINMLSLQTTVQTTACAL